MAVILMAVIFLPASVTRLLKLDLRLMLCGFKWGKI